MTATHGTTTHRTTHPTPDLFALSDIKGPVLRPGEDGYADEVTGFNLAALHTPDVVVGATGADDIVAALRWASATRTPVAVQATGHGANYPIDSGLLITTTRMTDVEIDPTTRTATASAGTKWRHVVDAAAPHGLAALTGTSTDAGVVGYTLGGGLPVLGRAYGYAADLVRSFQVVTPDGALHEATKDTEPELFWALRGGKGNVGIVTQLTFDLLPFSRLLGGGIYAPGEHTEALLRAWADWTHTVPNEMCSAFSLLRLPRSPRSPNPCAAASGPGWRSHGRATRQKANASSPPSARPPPCPSTRSRRWTTRKSTASTWSPRTRSPPGNPALCSTT